MTRYVFAAVAAILVGASFASAAGTPSLPAEEVAYCKKAPAKAQCEATRALVLLLKAKQSGAQWSDKISWDYVKDDESDMVFEFWLNQRTKTATA